MNALARVWVYACVTDPTHTREYKCTLVSVWESHSLQMIVFGSSLHMCMLECAYIVRWMPILHMRLESVCLSLLAMIFPCIARVSKFSMYPNFFGVLHVQVCTRTHTFTHSAHTHTHMHTHTHTHAHRHTHVLTHTHTHHRCQIQWKELQKAGISFLNDPSQVR